MGLAVAVKVATIVAAVASTATAIKSLTASTPGGNIAEPQTPSIQEAGQTAIDDVQEKNRLRKGRLDTIRNKGGGSGILTSPILGKVNLTNNDSKILLGA